MTITPKAQSRLKFLVRVVRKECQHLVTTDQHLFVGAFTVDLAPKLDADPDLAERVEAFVSRFGRLQDTVGDKLMPVLLAALGERPGSAIDKFDRTERLGLIRSTDEWMAMCTLGNQMVHEYVEDPVVLVTALQSGHTFVPALVAASEKMLTEIEQRGWA